MLELMMDNSSVDADQAVGFDENPSTGGGPVIDAIAGSACVGLIFEFAAKALGGGTEKSTNEMSMAALLLFSFSEDGPDSGGGGAAFEGRPRLGLEASSAPSLR